MTRVTVDSLLINDLATVFVHASPDITIMEMDLSATSGHPGIAAIGRIFSDGATRKLELKGIRRGTAQVTITADDGETTPVSVPFYVTVVP